ncbi:myelin protein zero-like protein 3 [Thalassophryne amazonica]|uniref:myelin protein zero-like protein 3 n=1 Tax=Thalassophryne amazonica TaxID=390379 RepID=UPI001471E78B|nr:myelin protein zero-like protein 3 [Thalassophryne amazonica]
MRGLCAGSSGFGAVLLLLCLVLSPVCSITVTTPAERHASKGDAVLLSCTFTSTNRMTSKMSVDWSYRPQSGGRPETFFHFSSQVFYPTEGQFRGRIQWQGRPAHGDASILLINATLNDNGTYTCSVRNPPDVHGSPTSQTVLTVTNKPASIRFSDVAVLLTLVLLPSAVITLILIGKMLCPTKQHNQSKSSRSPIEVTEGEVYGFSSPKTRESTTCCDLCLMDLEDEEFYNIKSEHALEEGFAESRC